MLQRKLRHLACTVAASAIAMAGLILAGTMPVLGQAKGGDEDSGKAKAADDDDNGKVSGPAPTAFSMNVGVQFGLTDATSDTALKFQGSLSF